MTSLAAVAKRGDRYWVCINWGSTLETRGPYRWRWHARFIAWLNDGIH